MMQKEIRDIAAYWGAPAKIGNKTVTTRLGSDGETVRFVIGRVEISWAHALSLLHQHKLDGVAIKLQLRPIQSLTNEEINTLTGLMCNGQSAKVVNRPIHQTGVESRYLLYLKNGSTLTIRTEGSLLIEWHTKSSELLDIPAGIAYLQSIGVYVPGTIDPQYVEILT